MRNILVGNVTPDGDAVYVEVGFTPDNIQVFETAVPNEGVHVDGFAFKRVAAGTLTVLAANIIEPFAGGMLAPGTKVIRSAGLPLLTSPNDLQNLTDGDTIETVPAGDGYVASPGFLLGADADLNTGDVIAFSCQQAY